MTSEPRTFKYKLDFYYQSALIYLVTLIMYGGIRGNFVEAEFKYVLNDPLLYVIVFFVLMSFVTLVLNMLRNRRLIITHDAVIFKHHWDERRVAIQDIEWMHIGREAGVQTSGRFQVILIKLKGKRRAYRIRVGRYEREKELVHEMQTIAAHVPHRKRRTWRRPRITDR
jgi:hypothetical protein